MNLQRRIGVLFGGSSSEKEVALEGGRNVYNKLDRTLFDPIPIFVDSLHRFWKISDALLLQNTTRDIEAGLATEGERILYEELPSKIEFAFIVGHGKFMEDGCLQGLLELLSVPYNGSGVLASALGMDKWKCRYFLISLGIAVPYTIVIDISRWEKEREELVKSIAAAPSLAFPIYVKPNREGCSTAITKVSSSEALPEAIDAAFQWDPLVLVEKMVVGTEVTVSVLGNEEKIVLPPTETPWSKGGTHLTLEDKFLPGGAEMITPARLEPELMEKVKATAEKICTEMRFLGYPRIDMFVTPEGRVVVLEVNTLPGITPSTMVFHQAAEVGMSPAQFLTRIVELGVEAHASKRGSLI